MFQRLEGRPVPSSAQGVTPLTSTGLSNLSAESSFSDTHHLVPRPPPYDTDPRYSRLQRDGLVSRREKSMSHIQEDSQLLTRSSSSSCVEHLGSGKKKNSADSEEECKACRTESEKLLSAKGSYGMGYVFATSEDEDVCPTCLDGNVIYYCFNHFNCVNLIYLIIAELFISPLPKWFSKLKLFLVPQANYSYIFKKPWISWTSTTICFQSLIHRTLYLNQKLACWVMSITTSVSIRAHAYLYSTQKFCKRTKKICSLWNYFFILP